MSISIDMLLAEINSFRSLILAIMAMIRTVEIEIVTQNAILAGMEYVSAIMIKILPGRIGRNIRQVSILFISVAKADAVRL